MVSGVHTGARKLNCEGHKRLCPGSSVLLGPSLFKKRCLLRPKQEASRKSLY